MTCAWGKRTTLLGGSRLLTKAPRSNAGFLDFMLVSKDEIS
jgi:hypothetical protein